MALGVVGSFLPAIRAARLPDFVAQVNMTPEKLQSLRIPSEAKDRSQTSVWLIFIFVAAVAGVALFFAWPRESDKVRTAGDKAARESAAEKRPSRLPSLSNVRFEHASATPSAASPRRNRVHRCSL